MVAAPRFHWLALATVFLLPGIEALSEARGQTGPPIVQIEQARQSVVRSIIGQRRSRRPARRRMVYEEAPVANGGKIEGVVLFKGTPPPLRKIEIVKDTDHCGHRPTEVPQIEVNDRGQVTNAVVFLGDIRRGKAIPTPKEKFKIDQKTCTFDPHVQVIPTRQAFEVVNSDPLLHNIHATQGVRELFNRAQPQQGMRFEDTFTRGGLVTIRCQAHPWMLGFVYVMWHPYYDVTDDKGAFELTEVPPGEYEFVVWQEHLGEQTAEVKVDANGVTRVEFALEPRQP